MKKILVLYRLDEEAQQKLIELSGDQYEPVFYSSFWSWAKYCQELREASIIIGEPSAEEMRLCKNLELMHITWSGVDYFLEAGTFPENAILCNMSGGYGHILAEHMLAMLLALCRRLPEYYAQQNEGVWNLLLHDKPVEGSTVLILGAGDVGTTLATWLRPMVKRIIGVRRIPRNYPDCFDVMITLDELDKYLPQADLILCCMPSTPQTFHLINERRLCLMKKDAVLVNAGRGNLIDSLALESALNDGWFWGVGLDVTDPEPLPQNHPLWKLPRVMITPHASGNSYALGSPTDQRIVKTVLANIERFINGMPVENRVDFSTGYRMLDEGELCK